MYVEIFTSNNLFLVTLEHFFFTQVTLVNMHISELLSEKIKFETCTFLKENLFLKM